MTFLYRRAALLAAIESVFRTDQVPTATKPTGMTGSGGVGDVDSTADVTVGTDQLTVTSSAGVSSGDGPFRLVLQSGAFPTAIPALSETADYFLETVDATHVRLHTTAASAGGTQDGAALVDLTVVAVGTFDIVKQNADAFLVEDPDFAPDITVVERNNVRVTLSPEPVVTARKIATMTFQHEVRGNSVTDGTVPPRVGVLLRGCGMSETLYGEAGNTEETILDDAAIHVNLPTGRFTYTKTTGFAGTLPRVVVLQCTTPGGTGVAEFTVFSPLVGNAASPLQAQVLTTGVVMTDAAAFTLAESAQITPTITTSFASGDTYVIQLAPAGHLYEPVSDGVESLSMYLHFGDSTGGIRHRMTGCRGTWSAEGEANDFARYSFTFTGDWIAPDDQVLPANPEYESTLPPSVELGNVVALGGKDFDATDPDEVNLCASSFSIDIANEVIARTCINAPESVAGAVITGRSPVGAFNPEVVQEAAAPFWEMMSDGDLLYFNVRVGKTQGNVTVFSAPQAQYSEMAYGNRDDLRIYDVTLALRTNNADDEVRVVIC